MPTMDEYARQPLTDRLERLERTADELATAIAGRSAGALVKRPDAKNWAAVEVICHLRDTEEGFGGRFQLLLAMDAPRLFPPDPDRWAIERQYLRNDAGEAIGAFRSRRKDSLELLSNLTPAQFARGGVHPVRGTITIEDFLTLMCWHDDNHLDQLRRALDGRA